MVEIWRLVMLLTAPVGFIRQSALNVKVARYRESSVHTGGIYVQIHDIYANVGENDLKIDSK